jgi:organic radical activating enzyme
MKTKINEIFPSIQGEGPVVGYKQLFIRFCYCNLNCAYCDTEFLTGKEYTPGELYEKITQEYNLQTFHSISLTGGEPLLQADFLEEFLEIYCAHKKEATPVMYLETNATLVQNLERIKQHIDIISADIKLNSSTGLDTIELHRKFFQECKGIETFAKIVFDENITNDEIENCCKLAKEFSIPLILQPKMIENKMAVSSDFCNSILEKFSKKYKNTRLIPQVHKFLNLK